ncbi:MAG: outer membrane beta-barrel protein [Steroidobacteraceae bacterium]|jgi:OOP family OmpA-OmpF porin
MKAIFSTLGLTLLCCGTALAADHGFYIGAGLGQSESGVRAGSFNFKDHDTGYKLIAGFRPLDLFAAELNYVDLGKPSGGGQQSKTTAADGFVLVFLPLPIIDVYGKVGLVSWKTDASAPTFSLSRSGSDFAWGAGVQFHLGSLAARLEFEALNASELASPTFVTLGATYTFL